MHAMVHLDCTCNYATCTIHVDEQNCDCTISFSYAQQLRCKTNEMDFEGFDAKTLFRQSVVAALQAIDQASNIEEPSPSAAAATGSDHSEIEAAISSIKTAIAEDACDWVRIHMTLYVCFLWSWSCMLMCVCIIIDNHDPSTSSNSVF